MKLINEKKTLTNNSKIYYVMNKKKTLIINLNLHFISLIRVYVEKTQIFSSLI